MAQEKQKHLLEVNDLYTSFNIPAGEVRSVNGVSFNVDKGKVLGIVGESGSGKSVTAYSIMQILQNPGRVVSGSIKFNGKELLGLPHSQLQKIRGEKISIIFQDPMSSLNPVYTIGNQMKEAIRLHPVKRIVSTLDRNLKAAKEEFDKAVKENDQNKIKIAKEKYREAKYKRENYVHDRALEMLTLVGINEPERRLKQYPFEFSGGMLQRIMIAMSLVCEPDLLIADEPTTALDVTIQAQILELLKDFCAKLQISNIRIIKRLLDDYVWLSSKIRDEAVWSKIHKQLFNAFAPIGYEVALGNLPDMESGFCSLANIDQERYAVRLRSLAAGTEQERLDADLESYAQKFIEKYDGVLSYHWTYHSVVVKYAVYGVVALDELKEMVQAWMPKKTDHYLQAIQVLRDYENVDDETLSEAVATVFKGLKEGVYSAEYILLSYELLQLVKKVNYVVPWKWDDGLQSASTFYLAMEPIIAELANGEKLPFDAEAIIFIIS